MRQTRPDNCGLGYFFIDEKIPAVDLLGGEETSVEMPLVFQSPKYGGILFTASSLVMSPLTANIILRLEKLVVKFD